MSRLRDVRDRPMRERSRVALATLAIVVVVTIVLITRVGGDARDPATATPAAPASPPVINPAPGRPSRTTTTSPEPTADIRSARPAARRFLSSYLPILYGRAEGTGVAGTTPQLRRELARGLPVPPRIRARHPQLSALDAQPQAPTSVLMTATIEDGIAEPFRLIFTVERQVDGRWLVTNIAND